MQVGVLGLGHIGLVQAVCLANRGHQVIGCDVNPERLALLSGDRPVIAEPGVSELLGELRKAGRLSLTDRVAEVAASSAVVFVCVQTPSLPDGDVDLSSFNDCMASLATALRQASGKSIVVVRSTVPPGTLRGVLKAHADLFGDGGTCTLLFNPEFLREGSAVSDFDGQQRTVIGVAEAGYRPLDVRSVAALYENGVSDCFVSPYEEIELLKYVENTWHALKVCFANEVGALARSFGADGQSLMDIFKRDSKLNISPAYLTPGLPFGGSCLPKDVSAIARLAARNGVAAPLIGAVRASNDFQFSRMKAALAGRPVRTMGLAGVSFKSGTGDMRMSVAVRMIEELADLGIAIVLYDREIEGDAISRHLRSMNSEAGRGGIVIAATPEQFAESADAIMLCNSDPYYRRHFTQLGHAGKIVPVT